MQISARSYLTAGISLTAATAIAFTPLAIPANEKAVTIPNVTISDIQLTVTPSEIIAFFADLQLQLEDFNQTLAEIAAFPGDTLYDGLQTVIDTNTEFFATLAGLTTNPNLLAILGALELGVNDGLESLQIAVGEVADTTFFTTRDLADLLTSTITGSLSNVLSSFVAVLNNPLEVANYAALLSTGVVGTGQLIATNGVFAGEVVRAAGFELTWSGLDLASYQIYNALFTVGDLADEVSAATGSDLIAAINQAVQSITLAPAQAINDLAFGITFDVLDGANAGSYQLLNSLGEGYYYEDELGVDIFVPGFVNIVGTSLQQAITAIGAGPLSPDNYLFAGGALLGGGFEGFNTSVRTAGNLGQIPFDVGVDVTATVTANITTLNLGFAQAIQSILLAVGVPADVAGIPVDLATQLNEVFIAGAGVVTEGLTLASDLIGDSTTAIIDVSNQIESAILGPLQPAAGGAGATALAAPTGAAAKKSTAVPSAAVPVAITEDNDVVEEPAVVEDDELESSPVNTPPAADPAAGTDDDDTAPKTETKKAEREAKKAERDAKKAEREAKKAERDDKKAERDGSGSETPANTDSDPSDSPAAA